MKCPHCNYEDGWSSREEKVVEGDYGGFYTMSNNIQMERIDRDSYWKDTQTKDLKGCPSCNKVFMD